MSTAPLNHYTNLPDVFRALENVHVAVDAVGLDRALHNLVQLRASQINGCGYCVKMHIREAREAGETNERLDRLVVWKQVSDFSPSERAALALTESLTQLDSRADYARLRAALREHFSDTEIGALVATIAMINLWNRIQISAR